MPFLNRLWPHPLITICFAILRNNSFSLVVSYPQNCITELCLNRRTNQYHLPSCISSAQHAALWHCQLLISTHTKVLLIFCVSEYLLLVLFFPPLYLLTLWSGWFYLHEIRQQEDIILELQVVKWLLVGISVQLCWKALLHTGIYWQHVLNSLKGQCLGGVYIYQNRN